MQLYYHYKIPSEKPNVSQTNPLHIFLVHNMLPSMSK